VMSELDGPPADGEPLDGDAFDGGEALIRAAADLGSDYVFSSSGSEWAPVWEAYAPGQRRGSRPCPTWT
jgi:hypothetical protein